MISLSTIQNAIFDALAACFGLSADSAAASALIHPAYTEPENAPRPARSLNVVYFDLMAEDDPGDRGQSESRAASSGQLMTRFSLRLCYRLQIICYGPDAEAHARRIRSLLYLDGAGKPRQILRKSGIFPIPDPPQPLLLHEQEGTLWRNRCDLTVSLRIADILETPIHDATHVPAVILHTHVNP